MLTRRLSLTSKVDVFSVVRELRFKRERTVETPVSTYNYSLHAYVHAGVKIDHSTKLLTILFLTNLTWYISTPLALPLNEHLVVSMVCMSNFKKPWLLVNFEIEWKHQWFKLTHTHVSIISFSFFSVWKHSKVLECSNYHKYSKIL